MCCWPRVGENSGGGSATWEERRWYKMSDNIYNVESLLNDLRSKL